MAGSFPLNYYGYNPPFFGGHQNVLSKQAGERIIKNDVQQLIMTSPGDRLMRPNWGTIVRRALFEPLTNDLLNSIISSISNALNTYEPRVSVKVTAQRDDDNNALNIYLVGTYTGQPNLVFTQEIAIPLPTGV